MRGAAAEDGDGEGGGAAKGVTVSVEVDEGARGRTARVVVVYAMKVF